MNTVLQAISEGWSWKLGTPVDVVATNCFGNVIVQNQDGDFYRIMPEEWQCELLARTPAELEEKKKTESFVRDWEMTPLVDRAVAAHGPLAAGECFFLVVPSMLGGKYAEENIRKITLPELLSYSGSMAAKIDDVPDGDSVIIVPKETEANQALQHNDPSCHVPCLRTYRASRGRG